MPNTLTKVTTSSYNPLVEAKEVLTERQDQSIQEKLHYFQKEVAEYFKNNLTEKFKPSAVIIKQSSPLHAYQNMKEDESIPANKREEQSVQIENTDRFLILFNRIRSSGRDLWNQIKNIFSRKNQKPLLEEDLLSQWESPTGNVNAATSDLKLNDIKNENTEYGLDDYLQGPSPILQSHENPDYYQSLSEYCGTVDC